MPLDTCSLLFQTMVSSIDEDFGDTISPPSCWNEEVGRAELLLPGRTSLRRIVDLRLWPIPVVIPCKLWLQQEALSSEPAFQPSWTTLWILGSKGTAVRPAGGIMRCRSLPIRTGQPNFLQMNCLHLSFLFIFDLYLCFAVVKAKDGWLIYYYLPTSLQTLISFLQREVLYCIVIKEFLTLLWEVPKLCIISLWGTIYI